MITVFLLLSLTCEGKYHTQCHPTLTKYETIEACEEGRVIPPFINFFGSEMPAKINKNTVCFPVAELINEGIPG